ncbi:hypothetical protein GOP47_0026379 [Adiantum capillus-veneris]|nr:hypothetical protein GOP47_0026379 [Adiantum capillus-veneris]
MEASVVKVFSRGEVKGEKSRCFLQPKIGAIKQRKGRGRHAGGGTVLEQKGDSRTGRAEPRVVEDARDAVSKEEAAISDRGQRRRRRGRFRMRVMPPIVHGNSKVLEADEALASLAERKRETEREERGALTTTA